MKQRFGARYALKLPAHITILIPFKMEEELEPALNKAIGGVCAEVTPFIIKLDGFGSFPPRVIFVRIAEHRDLQQLHKKLAAAVGGVVPLAGKKKEEMHPHITIASRDLKKENFMDAWNQFRDRVYRAEFMAEKIALFKHNGRSWNAFREFGFEGKFIS